jgi:hypothetical protein
MATSYSNILSIEDIDYINNLPEVIDAKKRLESSKMVYFSISLPDSIKNKIQEKMELNLSSLTTIPMRWIKGDTLPHIDHGATDFQNTYFMYLNNSEGSLIVDKESYPISQGTGYVFQEGLDHETKDTGMIPRLLLGPMNELGMVVGTYETMLYYSTQNGALTTDVTKLLGVKYYQNQSTDFEVGIVDNGNLGGRTKWRLASNSTGPSPQNVIYQNGDVLDSTGFFSYYLYPVTNRKPKNQRQVLRKSLTLSPVWVAYKYYETRALKFGFTRITLKNYKKRYYQ